MSVTADTILYTADNITWPTADGYIPAVAALYDDADVFHVPSVMLSGAEQTLSAGYHDDADTFYAPGIALEGEVVPVPPVSIGGGLTTRHHRRVRVPDLQLEPALYIDTDTFHAPSIELTEDVVSAPPIQPELPLVELRPVTKALPTDASSSPVSIVSAKPRIATTLRPMIAESHKVVAGAANAVVNDTSDEEIMLILLEAA